MPWLGHHQIKFNEVTQTHNDEGRHELYRRHPARPSTVPPTTNHQTNKGVTSQGRYKSCGKSAFWMNAAIKSQFTSKRDVIGTLPDVIQPGTAVGTLLSSHRFSVSEVSRMHISEQSIQSTGSTTGTAVGTLPSIQRFQNEVSRKHTSKQTIRGKGLQFGEDSWHTVIHLRIPALPKCQGRALWSNHQSKQGLYPRGGQLEHCPVAAVGTLLHIHGGIYSTFKGPRTRPKVSSTGARAPFQGRQLEHCWLIEEEYDL